MTAVVESIRRRTIYIQVEAHECTCELKDAIEKMFGDSPYFEGKNQIVFDMPMHHQFIDYDNQEIAELVNKMITKIKKENEEDAKADEATYKKLDKIILEDATNPLAESVRVAIQHRFAIANEFAKNGQYTEALGYRADAEDLHAVFKFILQGKWKRAVQAYKLLDTIVRESIPYENVAKIHQMAGIDF